MDVWDRVLCIPVVDAVGHHHTAAEGWSVTLPATTEDCAEDASGCRAARRSGQRCLLLNDIDWWSCRRRFKTVLMMMALTKKRQI